MVLISGVFDALGPWYDNTQTSRGVNYKRIGGRPTERSNCSIDLNNMASSILGRKVLPAAAAAFTANFTCGGGVSSMRDDKSDGLWANVGTTTRTLCEAGRSEKVKSVIGKINPGASNNLFLIKESGIRETVLRKRVSACAHDEICSFCLASMCLRIRCQRPPSFDDCAFSTFSCR